LRLLLDEHFSFRIAEALRTRGHDAVAMCERPDLREMPDEDLLRCAHANGRALVTENVQDFLPIHGRFLAHGEQHSGLVLTSDGKFPRTRAGTGRLIAALAGLVASRRGPDALGSDVVWL
jgi:predicted nuclease of predicted toxin-antitoxin system